MTAVTTEATGPHDARGIRQDLIAPVERQRMALSAIVHLVMAVSEVFGRLEGRCGKAGIVTPLPPEFQL